MSAFVRFFKFAIVLGVIAALAFFAYRRGQPASQGQHPLAVHLRQVRVDAESLLAQVSVRIDLFDATLVGLAKGMESTSKRVSHFDAEIAAALKVAGEQQHSLATYSALLVDDQGVVLPNGTYISQQDVRNQIQFEEAKLTTIKQRIQSLDALRESVFTLHTSLKKQHERAHAVQLKLSEAKDRLEEQVAQIATLSEAISTESTPTTFAGDLRRLESDVAGLQDQIDAYSNGLPEVLSIEQVNGKMK